MNDDDARWRRTGLALYLLALLADVACAIGAFTFDPDLATPAVGIGIPLLVFTIGWIVFHWE